ncbi:MAG: peptidase S53, partial [Ktedonobacteraceae bacterium]|nr:peptidase S53 [Ktedonobacteraceae bacterium]
MDESSSLPMRTLGKLRFSFKKPRVLFPLLSIALMLIMIAVYFSPLNIFTGAKADTVTQLPGQVSPLIKQSQVQGATDPNTPISVVVGLRMRNQDGLANYIKTTSQAKKGLKRSMTAAQLIQAYAPLPTSEQAVIAFMQQYGFTTKQTFKHHIVVTFQGTVGQAQNAFKLQINNYRSTSGQTFYAPATDPVLPSTLAPLVQSITGLDNATHLSRPPVKQAGLQSNAQLNANAVTCPGSFSDANYYTSSQIASAYNLNTLHSAGLNGEGQIVGLVEFSGYRTSDISAYTSCYGKSRAPITNISVSDGVHTGAGLDGNSIEVELDMELILSAAPNLANLRVYEAPNTSPGSLAMWAQIVNDAVPVVSTSWGLCEADTTIGEAQQENNLFMLAAAQGQSIFSAAGDRGSLDDNG